MRTKTNVFLLSLAMGLMLYASGIIPAIVPQAVPTANKIGNSAKFQLGATGAVSGDCPTFDANLNITGPGTGAGCSGTPTPSGGLTVYSGPAGIALSGTAFFPIGGGSIANTTEASVQATVRTATTFTNLGADLSVALGGGNSVAFTLRKNGGDTTLTCTISGASATACADVAHSVAVVSGDILDIQAVFGGTIIVAPVFVLTAQVGTLLSSAFNVITTGTNAAALHVGTAGTLDTTGTGLLTANALRAYTVATLPGSPVTGQQAYVTDGNSTTDCTTGTGSTQVLCGYNGAAWAAEGGGASATFYPSTGSLVGPAWGITLPPTTGWTFFNGGASATDSTYGYTYILFPKASASQIRALCRTAPSTPYSVYTLIQDDNSGGPAGGSEVQTGIGFSDGTKYYIMGAGYTSAANTFNTGRWNTTSSFNNNPINNNALSVSQWNSKSYKWYRISDDGTTNIKFYYSLDGNHWITFDTAGRTAFLSAVTNVCFVAYANTVAVQYVVLSWTTDATP